MYSICDECNQDTFDLETLKCNNEKCRAIFDFSRNYQSLAIHPMDLYSQKTIKDREAY